MSQGMRVFFVWILTLTFLVGSSGVAAPGAGRLAPKRKPAQTACDHASFARRGLAVFRGGKSGSIWVSPSVRAEQFFVALGFQRAGTLSDAIGKGVRPVNATSCEAKAGAPRVFRKDGLPFDLIATRECDFARAAELGLSIPENTNFGSMEGGLPIYGAMLDLSFSDECWEQVIRR